MGRQTAVTLSLALLLDQIEDWDAVPKRRLECSSGRVPISKSRQRFERQLEALSDMKIGDPLVVRPDKSVVAAKERVEIVGNLLPITLSATRRSRHMAQTSNQLGGGAILLVILLVSSSANLLLESVHAKHEALTCVAVVHAVSRVPGLRNWR